MHSTNRQQKTRRSRASCTGLLVVVERCLARISLNAELAARSVDAVSLVHNLLIEGEVVVRSALGTADPGAHVVVRAAKAGWRLLLATTYRDKLAELRTQLSNVLEGLMVCCARLRVFACAKHNFRRCSSPF